MRRKRQTLGSAYSHGRGWRLILPFRTLYSCVMGTTRPSFSGPFSSDLPSSPLTEHRYPQVLAPLPPALCNISATIRPCQLFVLERNFVGLNVTNHKSLSLTTAFSSCLLKSWPPSSSKGAELRGYPLPCIRRPKLGQTFIYLERSGFVAMHSSVSRTTP